MTGKDQGERHETLQRLSELEEVYPPWPEHLEVMRGHPADMAVLRLDFEVRLNGSGVYGHPAFPIFVNYVGAVRGLVQTCSLDTAKERGWLGSSST
ncbi:MAG: hypothetical protein H0V83_02775 [Rubrobacter sp.]|nr:hypothetical protein [Rubrobacter sp.]